MTGHWIQLHVYERQRDEFVPQGVNMDQIVRFYPWQEETPGDYRTIVGVKTVLEQPNGSKVYIKSTYEELAFKTELRVH